MTTFVLYKPTGIKEPTSHPLAARPSTLKTIGLLCNAKVNSEVYIERIRERLAEVYPDARFVFHKKSESTGSMTDEALAMMTQCDAVLNAFGD